MWSRFVLVPGLTDEESNVAGIAGFVAGLSTVERVEVLPFHRLGEHKWAELGLALPLKDTRPPDADAVERARAAFRDRGVPAL